MSVADGAPALAATGEDPVLELRDLRVEMGGRTVLGGVDLSVLPGEVVCLLGAPGSGKTTLLRALAGLLVPAGGSILLGGEDVSALAARHRPVNTLFQGGALFPHLNVYANLRFGLRRAGLGKGQIAERLDPMLALLSLEHLLRCQPAQLTPAERQRVALARCLVAGPRVLLLDEPFAGLDPQAREGESFAWRSLLGQLGCAAIMVTRDPQGAMAMGQRMGVLRHGRVVQFASPKTLYETPCDREIAQALGPVNLLEGVVSGQTEGGFLAVKLQGVDDALQVSSADELPLDTPVTVAVRPEQLRFLTAQDRVDEAFVSNAFEALVQQRAYRGESSAYRLTFAERELRITLAHGCFSSCDGLPAAGDRVRVAFAPQSAWALTE